MESTLQTPVVLLIFNRPETTRQVFDVIRSARPKTLLVVADGPRPSRPEDAKRVAAVRQIIESVDWPCEVLKRYSDTNLGCRNGVASGINWAFAEVPEAIILEDDCVPHPSFFSYCEQLLERHREDSRIMAICGRSKGRPSNWPYSYFYTRSFSPWGWATWRQAWQHFDLDMKTWPIFRDGGGLDESAESPAKARFLSATFESTFRGLNDTWDWAWCYACKSQAGLFVRPSCNLIDNIGFGIDATHTTKDKVRAKRPLEEIGPLVHPPIVFHQRHVENSSVEPGMDSPGEGLRQRIHDLEQQILDQKAELREKQDVIEQFQRMHQPLSANLRELTVRLFSKARRLIGPRSDSIRNCP